MSPDTVLPELRECPCVRAHVRMPACVYVFEETTSLKGPTEPLAAGRWFLE